MLLEHITLGEHPQNMFQQQQGLINGMDATIFLKALESVLPPLPCKDCVITFFISVTK